MKIEVGNPPEAIRKVPAPLRYGPHGRYNALFEAIATGEWVSVSSEEVTGVNNHRKQSNLHALAKIRKMKIQTTVHNGRMFVRRIDLEQPEDFCIHCKEDWERAQQRDQVIDRA